MHRIGRTFVRLSPDNRRHIDGLRCNCSIPQDRLANAIVSVSSDALRPPAETRWRRWRAS